MCAACERLLFASLSHGGRNQARVGDRMSLERATRVAVRFNFVTTYHGSTTAMHDNSGIYSRRITRRVSAAFRAAVTCAGAKFRSAPGFVQPGTSGLGRWPARPSIHLILCALTCVMAVSGCAPPDPSRASAAPNPGPQACRPDSALLTPQPAPDCGFGRSDLKTLDPDQWARLKLEYELKCYKEAEKIARKRLQQLQAATKCAISPAR